MSVVRTTKTNVVLHPLCLLSVTDHYNRVAKDTRKRVVGVLLGSRNGDDVDIANSYGVPFEEDLKKSRRMVSGSQLPGYHVLDV